jgi:mannitol-specific phosphotransferase system IIBC component
MVVERIKARIKKEGGDIMKKLVAILVSIMFVFCVSAISLAQQTGTAAPADQSVKTDKAEKKTEKKAKKTKKAKKAKKEKKEGEEAAPAAPAEKK